MSGQAFKIFLLSSFAHTMNAFIGLLMWGLASPSLFGWRIIFAETTRLALYCNGKNYGVELLKKMKRIEDWGEEIYNVFAEVSTKSSFAPWT